MAQTWKNKYEKLQEQHKLILRRYENQMLTIRELDSKVANLEDKIKLDRVTSSEVIKELQLQIDFHQRLLQKMVLSEEKLEVLSKINEF